jgi:hypothetical protein
MAFLDYFCKPNHIRSADIIVHGVGNQFSYFCFSFNEVYEYILCRANFWNIELFFEELTKFDLSTCKFGAMLDHHHPLAQ